MNQFFVLLVENDRDIRRDCQKRFPPGGAVRLFAARTVRQASALIDAHFFHLALVDLSLNKADNDRVGVHLFDTLRDRRPSCRRFALTWDAEFAAQTLARARTPKIQGILGKLWEDSDTEFIEEQSQRWLSHQVSVSGLRGIVSTLCRKLEKPHPTYAEVDYLVSKIFGQGETVPTSIRKIELAMLQGGRSKSVVVFGQPQDASGRRGIWTVIKFSRLADARAEHEAYCKHVRFMLPLSQRVELLGYFEADTVGAMCFSFAGGSPQDKITSLEKLMHKEDESTFDHLDALQDSLGANWYSMEPSRENQTKYVCEKFGVDENLVRRKMHDFAIAIAPKIRAVVEADGLRFRGRVLYWPTPRDVTAGQLRDCPRCIIHGDLHAGNLLVRKGTRQVVMIDYRHTGPGPAYLDFAALDASPRVYTSARTINRHAVEDQVNFEPKVWDAAWSAPLDAKAPDELPFWARVSFQAIILARRKFPKLRPKDYAGTSLLWAMRLFALENLDDATRLRLLVWTSHLLAVLRSASKSGRSSASDNSEAKRGRNRLKKVRTVVQKTSILLSS